MIGAVGHIDETRLGRFAEQGLQSIPATEQTHLDQCDVCHRLLEGHRRAIAVLSGSWQPHAATTRIRDGDSLIVPRSRVRPSDRSWPRSGFLLPAVAAAALVLAGAFGTLIIGRPGPDNRVRPAVVVPSSSPAFLPPATLRPGSPPIEGGMVAQIDAGTGAVRDTITLGGRPGLLAEAGGYMWVFNFGDGSVARINPASSRVEDSLRFDEGAAAILGHGDDLWVTADEHDLIRIDGRTGHELEHFVLDQDLLFRTGDAGFLAFAGGSVWLTVPDLARPTDPHELWRVDPITGVLQARVTIDRDPHPPVTLDDVIYAVSPTRNTVTRIDPETNDVVSVRVGAVPVAVAGGAGSIWVAHDRDLSVWRLDPKTLIREATIDIGERVHSVAFGNGNAWATTRTSLHQIDPATNRVIATTRLVKLPGPRGPAGILVLGGSVWVGIEGR